MSLLCQGKKQCIVICVLLIIESREATTQWDRMKQKYYSLILNRRRERKVYFLSRKRRDASKRFLENHCVLWEKALLSHSCRLTLPYFNMRSMFRRRFRWFCYNVTHVSLLFLSFFLTISPSEQRTRKWRWTSCLSFWFRTYFCSSSRLLSCSSSSNGHTYYWTLLSLQLFSFACSLFDFYQETTLMPSRGRWKGRWRTEKDAIAKKEEWRMSTAKLDGKEIIDE